MIGIGGLSYEIEDGRQPGLYFGEDFLRPGRVKVILVVKQGDGLLDEQAVVHRQRHLSDGVVRVGVGVVDVEKYYKDNKSIDCQGTEKVRGAIRLWQPFHPRW